MAAVKVTDPGTWYPSCRVKAKESKVSKKTGNPYNFVTITGDGVAKDLFFSEAAAAKVPEPGPDRWMVFVPLIGERTGDPKFFPDGSLFLDTGR